ncbi:hypothetical protein D3C72_1626510 [compost metagenome]
MASSTAMNLTAKTVRISRIPRSARRRLRIQPYMMMPQAEMTTMSCRAAKNSTGPPNTKRPAATRKRLISPPCQEPSTPARNSRSERI